MFIALVRERRGERLVGPEKALFSGEYWGGERARLFGLIDGIGDVRSTLRERFGDKVITPLIVERGFFGRKQPGVSFGAEALFDRTSLAEDVLAALESRTIWGRYGL
jgi:serine protease SohB